MDVNWIRPVKAKRWGRVCGGFIASGDFIAHAGELAVLTGRRLAVSSNPSRMIAYLQRPETLQV